MNTVAARADATAGDFRSDGGVMNRSTKFWDKVADKYSRQPIADEAAYQKKLEITRTYLTPESRVLEFGCGTGSTAIVHAPNVQHILALDVSSKMLEIAQRKADAAGLSNITFRQSPMSDHVAPDASFDVVLGMSILHLLEDKDAAIRSVYRMLKPGGVFISSTVCLGQSGWYFPYLLPLMRLIGQAPMVRIFSKPDLVASMKHAGFEIEVDWLPDHKTYRVAFLVAKKPGD